MMSGTNEMQVVKNSNERINWIEEAISKKHIKYYKYEDFNNIQNIDRGNFGKIYRANWKISEKYFVLKSLFNPDENAVQEIVREAIINLIIIFPI